MSYLDFVIAQPPPPSPLMLNDSELPRGFTVGLSKSIGKGKCYFLLFQNREMVGKYLSRDLAISAAKEMAKEIA